MIQFNKKTKIYTLQASQELPISLSESWSFFSDPNNLSKMTPKHMNFKILTDLSSMYEGQIIKYRVSPFPFFRVGWTTEITKVKKPFFFIDEQTQGPFDLWHHEHNFEEIKNGIITHDKVLFKLPLGKIGRFFGEKIVINQLKNIFDFRKDMLNKLYVK
jgi:ligand-binding SRPBCC domain-containing protein|tara:strand:- start:95 stop:571 length:477 start_codon:yes stop_codon:yes gene_type:complete